MVPISQYKRLLKIDPKIDSRFPSYSRYQTGIELINIDLFKKKHGISSKSIAQMIPTDAI